MAVVEVVETQICSRCGIDTPLSQFGRTHKQCNPCRAKLERHKRQENPERIRAQEKARYYGNHEHELAQEKARRHANLEETRRKIAFYARQGYAKNPAKGKLRRNSWRQKHIEVVRKRARLSSHKYRLLSRNKDRVQRLEREQGLCHSFSVSDWDYAVEYWRHACALCGAPDGFWLCLAQDHWIPVADPTCPGTVPWNILPLCHGRWGCNNGKGKKSGEQYVQERFKPKEAAKKLQAIEAFFVHMKLRAGEGLDDGCVC
jgi:hypothetical protein